MKVLGRVDKETAREFIAKSMELDDKELYKEVGESQQFVFQYSGALASKMIQEAQPDNFDDICSINAMARPGSSSMFPDFLEARKYGTKKYPEQIDKLLLDTRGCILYQEEIMSLFKEIAGYSGDETNCFTGNTLISTENGKKMIKDIAVGEKVWSLNSNGEKELDEVVDAWNNGKKKIINIELENNKCIKCTPEHLFYTKNRGWVKAIELTEEDELMEIC